MCPGDSAWSRATISSLVLPDRLEHVGWRLRGYRQHQIGAVELDAATGGPHRRESLSAGHMRIFRLGGAEAPVRRVGSSQRGGEGGIYPPESTVQPRNRSARRSGVGITSTVGRQRIAQDKPRRSALAIFEVLEEAVVDGAGDPAGDGRLVELQCRREIFWDLADLLSDLRR